jgi:HPt (histidine-containing phosphotransfer) domain-containing protein
MTGERDPALAALWERMRAEFAAGLPARVAQLEDLEARGAWTELRRAAHRLRGSGPTYGAVEIGSLAGIIEDVLLDANGAPEPEGRERIRQSVAGARALAERAAKGDP